MSAQPVPPSVDRGRVAWLLAGGAALVGGTLLGWNGTLLEAIATPPALVRAALVGASVVVAGWLIIRAIRRMEDARGVPSGAADRPRPRGADPRRALRVPRGGRAVGRRSAGCSATRCRSSSRSSSPASTSSRRRSC